MLQFINPQNTGKFSAKFIAYNILAPELLFFSIGYLINHFHKIKSVIKYKKAFIIIALLVLVDQVIKFILIQYKGDPVSINTLQGSVPYTKAIPQEIKGGVIYTGVQIPVISDWLSIQVVHNLKFPPLILTFTLFPIAMFVLDRFFRFKKLDLWFYTIFLIFFGAGIICSFIDRVVYSGSYDYIHMAQFAVADLKDIYLYIGVTTMLQEITNYKIWNMKDKNVIGNISSYLKYEKAMLGQFLHRNTDKK
ncbi:hypothetical protein FACS189462_1740 [Spirochaetia bacterium]|nr:hypothetical protein FACS189462_1740 [Spirochaetia bacterium]